MTESLPPFTVNVVETDQDLRLVVCGDFDAYTTPRFDAACDDAALRAEETPTPLAVQLDLTETTLIDSAAITAILRASHRFETFTVVATHGWQERLFGIVGLWESVQRAH